MMHQKKLIVLALALTHLSGATPAPEVIGISYPKNGICTDYTVKNTITSQNNVYGLPKFRDNFDVAASLFNISQLFRQTPEQGSISFNPFSGVENITASYTLAGTFCRPKAQKDGKEKTVLVATHGLGYDRRYWASKQEPDKYNFAQVMLDSGYSIFYYDRLGTGSSQKISGYDNQLSIQTELLKQLVLNIRKGQYTDNIKAEKIALVGHSYGSSISAALIAEAPDIAEALILTGYSILSSKDALSPALQTTIPSIFANRLASPTHPLLDSGYLMFGDKFAHAETFFYQSSYTAPTFEYAHSISQPAAMGEFLTLRPEGDGRSAEFKGRVWIGTGQRDLIACSGNCDVAFRSEAYKDVYKGAGKVMGYVLADAGHGVNFHVNARKFFGQIVGYLDEGL